MNIDTWAAGLWGFVDDNLVSGRPFFLCVDGLALAHIAQQMGVKFGSASAAEEDFLLSCLADLIRFADRVLIDQSSFDAHENGRSLAICFAVQQVVAAERMINDDDGSSDSYYARYRQILGLDPGCVGSPLPYAQFAKIWDTVRRELLSLPNSDDNTVTFRLGTGKNKYRALPMSQALLDQESLRIIHERILDIPGRSDCDLIHRVRRVSRYLSKKSREKVYVEVIRSALLSQIRSFTLGLPSRVRQAKRTKRTVINAADFFIYIEDDGWDDVYRLGIRRVGEPADSETDLEEKLRSYFDQHSALPFKEGSVSDFEGMSGGSEVLVNAALVVVRKSDSESRDCQWVRYFEEPESCAIPDGYRMLLRDLSIPWAALADESVSIESSNGISFTGGIVVDRLRQIYLVGFAPTAVQIGGEPLSSADLITVNGEAILVKRFLGEINECVGTSDFRVLVNERDGYLGIATTREADRLDLGYPIRGGFCTPTAVSVGEDDAVHHLRVPGDLAKAAAFDRRLARGELIKHLSIPNDQWIPTTSDTVETMVGIVERELSGSMLCKLSVSEIRRRRAIPITLLMVIEEVSNEVA